MGLTANHEGCDLVVVVGAEHNCAAVRWRSYTEAVSTIVAPTAGGYETLTAGIAAPANSTKADRARACVRAHDDLELSSNLSMPTPVATRLCFRGEGNIRDF